MSTDYTSLEEGQKKTATFERTQTTILHHMLQRSFDYSGQKAESVHVYFQIGDGHAAAEFLYGVVGHVLAVDELHRVQVEPPLDLSEERLRWLQDGIAQELLAFINHSLTHNKPLPNEVWVSAHVPTDKTHTSFGYNYSRELPNSKDAVLKWKNELADPNYKNLRDLSIIDLNAGLSRLSLDY